MQYSLPYLALMLFMLLISALQLGVQLSPKSRGILNFSVLGAYFLFFGFRGLVGWDWFNYYMYFQEYEKIKIEIFEPGFSLYVYIIKIFFNSYEAFIAISTLIHSVLIHIFLKQHLTQKYYAFGFMIFLGFSLIILETDLFRNIKSLLLFLISLKYIDEQKPTKFFILNIIGLTIHWSSLFMLPMYFILKKRISLKTFIIAFVIGNIVILGNIHFIKPILLFLSEYLNEEAADRILFYTNHKLYAQKYDISYGYFARQATTILFMLYYNKIANAQKSNIIFINSFFIYIFVYFFFSEINIIISRVGIFFGYSICILIPRMVELIKPISTRLALIGLYIALSLAKIYGSTNNIFYDYDNSLLGDTKSYDDRAKIYKKFEKKLSEGK